MMTNSKGEPFEAELAVRARAEAECMAELERIKVRAWALPFWLGKTVIGRMMASRRLMAAYRFQLLKADRISCLDVTIGAPHRKLAGRLLDEAARARNAK